MYECTCVRIQNPHLSTAKLPQCLCCCVPHLRTPVPPHQYHQLITDILYMTTIRTYMYVPTMYALTYTYTHLSSHRTYIHIYCTVHGVWIQGGNCLETSKGLRSKVSVSRSTLYRGVLAQLICDAGQSNSGHFSVEVFSSTYMYYCMYKYMYILCTNTYICTYNK